MSEAEIVRRLAAAQANPVPISDASFPPELLLNHGDPQAAAVLAPLLWQDGAWSLLYIRRTQHHNDRHSGQVAFPGGRSDPADHSLEDTALRETAEEIGIAPAAVRILGRLDTFLTITNYHVTPLVGVIPWPVDLRLNTSEVSRAFTIPLAWLADPANREQRVRELPAPYAPVSVIYFRPYDDEVLWGATARFTTRLLEVLGAI